jgi:hypothetical protein
LRQGDCPAQGQRDLKLGEDARRTGQADRRSGAVLLRFGGSLSIIAWHDWAPTHIDRLPPKTAIPIARLASPDVPGPRRPRRLAKPQRMPPHPTQPRSLLDDDFANRLLRGRTEIRNHDRERITLCSCRKESIDAGLTAIRIVTP